MKCILNILYANSFGNISKFVSAINLIISIFCDIFFLL